ncbi:MAG: hypothetical protein AB8B50_08660 [Pirellulaceae bacterium]
MEETQNRMETSGVAAAQGPTSPPQQARFSTRAVGFIAAFCLLLIPLYFVARDIESYKPWLERYFQLSVSDSQVELYSLSDDPNRVLLKSNRLYMVDLSDQSRSEVPIPVRFQHFLGVASNGLVVMQTMAPADRTDFPSKWETILSNENGVQQKIPSEESCLLVGNRYLIQMPRRSTGYGWKWMDLEGELEWNPCSPEFEGSNPVKSVLGSNRLILNDAKYWRCIEMTPTGQQLVSRWRWNSALGRRVFGGLVVLENFRSNTYEIHDLNGGKFTYSGDLLLTIQKAAPAFAGGFSLPMTDSAERFLYYDGKQYFADRSSSTLKVGEYSTSEKYVEIVNGKYMLVSYLSKGRSNPQYFLEYNTGTQCRLDTKSRLQFIELPDGRLFGLDTFGNIEVFDPINGNLVQRFCLYTRNRILAVCVAAAFTTWFAFWLKIVQRQEVPRWAGSPPFFIAATVALIAVFSHRDLTLDYDLYALHWQVVEAFACALIVCAIQSSYLAVSRPVPALLPITAVLAFIFLAALYVWGDHWKESAFQNRSAPRIFQESVLRFSMFALLVVIPFFCLRCYSLRKQGAPVFQLTDIFISTSVIAGVYAVLIRLPSSEWADTRSVANLASALIHSSSIACIAVFFLAVCHFRLRRWLFSSVILTSTAVAASVAASTGLGYDALGLSPAFSVAIVPWSVFVACLQMFLWINAWLSPIPLQVDPKNVGLTGAREA